MNWSLVLPEAVLAVCAMAILLAGVMQKRDSTVLCTMAALAACAVAGALVLAMDAGTGFGGLFVTEQEAATFGGGDGLG